MSLSDFVQNAYLKILKKKFENIFKNFLMIFEFFFSYCKIKALTRKLQ